MIIILLLIIITVLIQRSKPLNKERNVHVPPIRFKDVPLPKKPKTTTIIHGERTKYFEPGDFKVPNVNKCKHCCYNINKTKERL